MSRSAKQNIETMIRECELKLDALAMTHPDRAALLRCHTRLCNALYQDDRRYSLADIFREPLHGR